MLPLAHPPRVGPRTLANPKPTGVGKGGPGGGAPWQGVVGGVPPQNQKRERVASINKPATSGTQNAGKPSAHGGGQNGGSMGAEPPWQGVVGGVPPQNQKRGRVARISNPATSGTQNAGEPSASGGGQNGGSMGAEPPGKGLWGVSPHKTKRGSELPALATQPRVGPKTLANSKPTGVGKGSPGARPYAKPYGEITTKVPGLSGEEYTKPAPTGRAGSVQ